MSAAQFMNELEEATTPNPFYTRERVWEWKAVIEVSAADEEIWLKSIRSLLRKQGWGSAALAWLCDLADRHGVMIWGTVEPIGTTRPRLGVVRLRRWYRRHGFTVTKDDWMRRYPRKRTNH